MIGKLKLLYKLSPILLAVITAFALYFAYNCYQDEKTANNKLTELVGKIDMLVKQQEKQEQIIAEREQEKSTANLEVKKLQERLKNAIKDNQCANEPMPNDIIDWMRNGKN